MKKYEHISEEDLVEKILRAQLLKDMGFRLCRSEVQEDFNKFWGIDIKKIISKFNEIQKLIEHLAYMNEELVCDNCGRHFTRWERNASNKSGRHFCSVICSKRFAASFALTEEKKLKLSNTIKQLCQKDKFIRKAKYDLLNRICPICGNPIPYERRHKKTCSTKCGRKLNGISNHNTQLKRHTSGGIRQGSSHGKKGWYKGYWCDSSWELAYVIYNMEHNIDFKRNHEYFNYQFKGKTYKYYPDFIMNDGTLVEVKGYSSKKWQAKLKAFPKNRKLQVLYRSDIKPILEYVTKKYGKNFIDLYE